MGIHNADVADAFEELGDLLAIEGENPFRIRAYRRAAQVIRDLPRDVTELDLSATGGHAALPGIGRDLSAKISEYLATGHLRALERLRAEVPAGARGLLRLPGLGPVRVRALMTGLKVSDPEQLKRVLESGKVAMLRGFGPTLQDKLRKALEVSAADPRAPAGSSGGRLPWSVAAQYAAPLRRYLEGLPGVRQAVVAGSWRRGRDTVGDLDVVLSAPAAARPLQSLDGYEDVSEVLASGPTRATARLRNGLQVDVRVVEPGSFGAALQYFTGSKDHSIALRRRAQERGLKLSEYGVFRGEQRIAGATEEEVYRALELDWIPPELREARGEIEAAQRGRLPVLVEQADLRGDLHVHTNASDGRDSLEDMVAAARRRRLSYIAITDHASRMGIVHGLDPQRLMRQCAAIDALNARLKDFTVFKGAEVDILEDGSLALPDAALAQLDVVVIAVHSHFDLPEKRQTQRLLRALERPNVAILAHPSARLIGSRPPLALDFPRLFEAVRERGCCLEVDSQPLRLDLDDVQVKAAREHGVSLCIDSDAHAASQFDNLEGGVRQARRGWATKQDVLNTRSAVVVRRFLRRQRNAK